ADIAVRVSGASASVELRQTFAQGTFKDEGPKRLVVVKEGGALRIAREEMLRSTVASAAPTGPRTDLLLTTYAPAAVYLDLDADPTWGRGALRAVTAGSSAVRLYEQAATAAPPTANAWAAQPLTAYDADGAVCTATIGALTLRGGGTPHFGTV